MIKSDFGTVEVTGLKPVVMAEFEQLLEVLRRELGEELYNMVLQDANNSKKFGDEPEEKKSEFEPHLSQEYPNGEIVDFGSIGEETNIYDITGENLTIGDTVNLYFIKGNGQLEFHGEHSVVSNSDGKSFVMGVLGSKFNRGVSDGYFKWLIVLNRRHTEIKDGETVDGIKYIKSERTGK